MTDETRPNPSSALPRRKLFGLSFIDAAQVSDVVDEMMDTDTSTLSPKLPLLLTPNVDHLVQLERSSDDHIRQSTSRAAFLLPDGQPIVWASRLLGQPLRARLTGSDLFSVLWTRLVGDNTAVLLVVPSQQVADRLRAEHASAVTVVPPMFDASDTHTIAEITRTCLQETELDPPRYVMVCIAQPKQQQLALSLLSNWPESATRPLIACLGASAEMYLGVQPRAPMWMRRLGLEWFHRFLGDPRRLFRRYFIDDMAFIGILAREWLAKRRLGADYQR